MKRYFTGLTREQADRIAGASNKAKGSPIATRGVPAEGHAEHPNSPLTWDGTGYPEGEAPPGWTLAKRPIENPKVRGEFMVRMTGTDLRRIAASEDVSEADKVDIVSRESVDTLPLDYEKPKDPEDVEPEPTRIVDVKATR